MKKNVRRFYRLLMVLLILSAGALFVSCSSTYSENADPKSIISERYGNKTYTINFSSATLSTPVAPMEYTALSIPKLPTPERVGYVFQGWYYDANYLTPYTQDSLYMKMSDVTLYAKWTEEQIVNSGIYGIKCEFTLVEDSLKLSAYAEENGYGDLNDYLIDSEIYMEKADDGLFLRFQFDSGYQSSAETFAFAIGAESGSKFRIASEKTIQIASESKRTYYIDWKNNKIDEPCYLAVTYYNTKAADEGVDVATTAAYYTLRVEIKEFYGFEQSYVKVRSSLDDGWYSRLLYQRRRRADGNVHLLRDLYLSSGTRRQIHFDTRLQSFPLSRKQSDF